MNGPGSVTQMAGTVRIKQAGTYISNVTVDAGTIRGYLIPLQIFMTAFLIKTAFFHYKLLKKQITSSQLLYSLSATNKMWSKVLMSCMLLLVQLGDGKVPTNRPSNGK